MRGADETKQFVDSYIRAFNDRDLEAVAAMYAEDATLEDPVGSSVHEGKAAIRAFYAQYRDQPSFLQLTGDLRYAGDAVAFSFFCFLGSGKEPMIVQITDTFRFDADGRIKEMRAFWGETNIIGRHADRQDDGGQLPLAGVAVLIVGDGPAVMGCSQRLASKGAVIVVASPAAQAELTVRSVREAGGRAHALPTVLANDPELLTVADRAMELCGRLDRCVNVFELGQSDQGKATARCAAEQVRVLHRADLRGAIVNVIAANWNEARPEALRPGGSRMVRINCVIRAEGASPEAIAESVMLLMSREAEFLDDQTLTVGNPD